MKLNNIKNFRDNHSVQMIIIIVAHLAPLLLFLILPKFGISAQWTLAFAALSMAVAHALTMKSHSHNHHEKHKEVYDGLLSK